MKIYKKMRVAAVASLLAFVLGSCNSDTDSNWDKFKDWRIFNQNWLIEQTTRSNPDGTSYFTQCTMPSDPQAYVLMHRIGEVHTENLQPLYTSATKVNYTLTLANDSVADKGTGFISQLNSTSLITGWGLSIMQLHVGDSAEFIVPYTIGYGESGMGDIKPYSNLRFNIRLVDITAYEVKP